MDIKILRPNDCSEALYINGKLCIDTHSLDAMQVVEAIAKHIEGVTTELVSVFRIEDSRLEFDKDGTGADYLDGKLIWDNDGVPATWPFDAVVPD